MKQSEKKYLVIGSLLLVWMFIFTFINSTSQSFWYDELASIGFVRSGISLKEMFQTYLYAENNLPLYSIILYFTYRIMPYGEQFLLIPSILFCIGGIIFLAAVMHKISGGYRNPFIVLCLGCASNALIWQGAWEIRCYSMVFFLSTVTLYAYVCKYLYPNTRHDVLYCVSVLFFLWTHWFACILLALYGIVDLIMVIRKKVSFKKLLYYIPGLIIYIPWFLISFYNRKAEFDNFWADVPTWKNMLWTVLFLLSGRRVLWYICLITCAVVLIIDFFKLIRGKLFANLTDILWLVIIIAIAWVIGIIFIYSYFINPEGSLYVERYFMVIAPHILLITAYGISFIVQFADKTANMKLNIKLRNLFSIAIKACICVLLAYCLVLCYKEEYIAIRKPFEEYEAVADYLIEEKGIWDEKSLFIGSNKYCALDGFIDYYFNKRGYEPPANIIDGGVHEKEETRFYLNYTQIDSEELLCYDKIYMLKIHMGYDDKLCVLIDENYNKADDTMDGIEIWEKKDN